MVLLLCSCQDAALDLATEDMEGEMEADFCRTLDPMEGPVKFVLYCQ